ncbi:MAG: hypothetical protein ABW095_10730 [Candidatus Thiodiazotropha sp.]
MLYKAHKHIIRGIVSKLGAFAICLAVGTAAQAEITVSSFPYSQSFNDSSYSPSMIWTSQGATHTWMPTSGWRGTGAAKFTPPTSSGGYSGLGQVFFANPQNQINVRFLVYHGSTWREYGPNNKVIIINREENLDRPMIISREYSNQYGTWATYGACDGTVCNYQGGDYWPDGTDEFRIGDLPSNREEEWISVEFEVNASRGTINMYIYTADGTLSGLYTSKSMASPGGSFRYIDILGGYMAAAVQANPDNYFMIDDLVINTSYIGPPQGFVGATPSPPTIIE